MLRNIILAYSFICDLFNNVFNRSCYTHTHTHIYIYNAYIYSNVVLIRQVNNELEKVQKETGII
jgi:hypothetical protein